MLLTSLNCRKCQLIRFLQMEIRLKSKENYTMYVKTFTISNLIIR
jgi:hypothetical protein